MEFKRSTAISGKFKNVCIQGGNLIDEETGEVINLIKILSVVYGSQPFSISTSQKADDEINFEGGDE